MVVISRTLPKSHATRWTAIDKLKKKKDNPGTNGNFLSTDTDARIDAMHTAFKDGQNLVSAKNAASVLATKTKDAALANMVLISSQYIQVLNMKIDRNIFPPAYRAYFKIPETSGTVPDQKTEAAAATLAQNIIDGEPAMIAGGGVASPYPLLSEVTAALTAFDTAKIAQSNAADALDTAQEALNTLAVDADKLIKRSWNEVETFFSEEETESMRENAREWGVFYKSNTIEANVIGRTVKIESGTTVGIPANILIEETEETIVADADGNFKLPTTGTGTVKLLITFTDLADKEVIVKIKQGEDAVIGEVVMTA